MKDNKKKKNEEEEGGLGIYASTKGIKVGYGITNHIFLDDDGLDLGFKLF